jgi:hypothetical protein
LHRHDTLTLLPGKKFPVDHENGTSTFVRSGSSADVSRFRNVTAANGWTPDFARPPTPLDPHRTGEVHASEYSGSLRVVSVSGGWVDRRVGRDGNVEAGTAQLDGEVKRPAERIHVAGDGVHQRDAEVEPFEAGHVWLCATPRCRGFVLGDTGGKSERGQNPCELFVGLFKALEPFSKRLRDTVRNATGSIFIPMYSLAKVCRQQPRGSALPNDDGR